MGKALYRSYRSKSFDEVIGQEHITETLKNSLAHGTYVHAYLLTGPRGVGKTSVARILAHEVNKVKYSDDAAHVDIIEIDAASNRRIDEIRELRERVGVAPTSLQYKVYIIDEVHMLTKEAFNALLKTLEEPPEHVIFVLATTDVHKVPDTIVSRCVRFHFKLVDQQGIKNHLMKISDKENIKISDDALTLIAQNSEGSFRDAISLLDQIRTKNRLINEQDVVRALGLGSRSQVDEIISNVNNGDIKSVLIALDQAYEAGANESRLARQLIANIRLAVMNDLTGSNSLQMISLAEDLLSASSKNDIRSAIEISLIKSAAANKSADAPLTKQTLANKKVPELPKPVEKLVERSSAREDDWSNALNDLKQKNRGLYSIARMATAEVKNDTLTLIFSFAFHQKQIAQPKNKQAILDTVKKHNQKITKVEIKQGDTKEKEADKEQDIKNISNIFGSSEVLES